MLFGRLAPTAEPAAVAPVDLSDGRGTAVSELTFGVWFEDVSTDDEWDGGNQCDSASNDGDNETCYTGRQ